MHDQKTLRESDEGGGFPFEEEMEIGKRDSEDKRVREREPRGEGRN